MTSPGTQKLELRNAVIIAVRIHARAKFSDMNFVYPKVASIFVAN